MLLRGLFDYDTSAFLAFGLKLSCPSVASTCNCSTTVHPEEGTVALFGRMIFEYMVVYQQPVKTAA